MLRAFLFYLFLIAALSSCNSNKVVDLSKKEAFVKDTITLLFAGDIMCHKPQVVSARIDSSYDFTGWFQHIKPIIASADIAFANLETTLSSTGRYSGYPRFKSPDELAYAIYDAGFDVVVTSNNHSNDTGPNGVAHTINVLKSLGLYQTGTFKSELEKSISYPLIFEKKGLKIGLLNYTYDTNGVPTRAPAVVNLIDTIAIKKDIAKAKATDPDILISFMHWGYEYHPKPNLKQIRMTKMMLREGVDHVIGAHPHVVQPVENIDGHLVAYSLGNFISNQRKKLTDGGIMVEMKLLKEEEGIRLLDWRSIPVWRYINKKSSNTYEIIPTKAFRSDTAHFHNVADYKAMIKFDNYIDDHLSDR
jgi:poly-gamma-glutamate synthesis protein (capsule biosynthesis protein)